MTTSVIQLEGLTCPSCVKKIEGVIGKMHGVENVKVLFHAQKVKVTFSQEQIIAKEISEQISKLGYSVVGER